MVIMFVPKDEEIEDYINRYLSMYREDGPSKIIDEGEFKKLGGN